MTIGLDMTWLCCLYVQLGTAFMAGHVRPPAGDTYWSYDINRVVNPYGTLEIGYVREFGHVELEAAVHHISSLPANDFGTNTAELRIRYFPWRHDE